MAQLFVKTPLIRSAKLSDRVGANVWLKMESAQLSGSFKARGLSKFAQKVSRNFIFMLDVPSSFSDCRQWMKESAKSLQVSLVYDCVHLQLYTKEAYWPTIQVEMQGWLRPMQPKSWVYPSQW